MREQTSNSSELLLQEWQFRREMVDYYCRLLQGLTPHDNNASQERRASNEKLSIAQLALRHASDQLDSYEHQQAKAGLPQQ